jgi:hypothetical protein
MWAAWAHRHIMSMPGPTDSLAPQGSQSQIQERYTLVSFSPLIQSQFDMPVKIDKSCVLLPTPEN